MARMRRAGRPLAAGLRWVWLPVAVLSFGSCSGSGPSPHSLEVDRVSIPDVPNCGDCEVSLTRGMTLQDPGGRAGLADEPLSIVRAANGQIFLASMGLQPLIFDADGVFVGFLGERGEGPGEFSGVRTFMLSGDSVVSYDVGLMRRSVWTEDGEFLTSSPALRYGFGTAVRSADGGLVISEVLSSDGMAGLPFHQFGSDGEWERSFGPDSRLQRGGDPAEVKRVLAGGSDSTFWAVRQHEYEVELISLAGQVLKVFDRETHWFPGDAPVTRVNLETPVSPRVRSVAVDPVTGYLWVLANVADEEWRSGVGEPARDRFGLEHIPVLDHDKVYDSVLEVLDPSGDGAVVATLRLDDYFFTLTSDLQLVSYSEDARDVPVIQFYSISLTGL